MRPGDRKDVSCGSREAPVEKFVHLGIEPRRVRSPLSILRASEQMIKNDGCMKCL